MISRLRGRIIDKNPSNVLVEVNGIGYELEISSTTFSELPPIEQEVILHTHFIVREDAHSLIGFATKDERTLFRAIIKINGVGPKLALSILSSITITDLVTAIEHKSVITLTAISGVGKKTAERIIIELQDKLPHLALSPTQQHTSSLPIIDLATYSQQQEEAISALVALGYKQNEAGKMVATAAKNSTTHSSQELIRLALKEKGKIHAS